jgi:excisionase family DNA binding protein
VASVRTGAVTERNENDDDLLTIREVAVLFRVWPRTVARWQEQGKLRAIRTPGGRLRFYRGDVERAVAEASAEDSD